MVSSCGRISMPRTAKTCSSNFRFWPILRTPASSSSGLSAASALFFRDLFGRGPAAEQAVAVAGLAMGQRHVARLVRRDRQRDAAQRRLHRVFADRLDVDRDGAEVEGARDPGIEALDALHDLVAARSILLLRAASSRAAASVCGVTCDRRLGRARTRLRRHAAAGQRQAGRRRRRGTAAGTIALRRGRRRIDRAGIDAGKLRDAPRQRGKLHRLEERDQRACSPARAPRGRRAAPRASRSRRA